MKTIKHETLSKLETYEEMKARHKREAVYHFVNETSKLGFVVAAVLWTLFGIWLWGPMIIRGVQALFGTN